MLRVVNELRIKGVPPWFRRLAEELPRPHWFPLADDDGESVFSRYWLTSYQRLSPGREAILDICEFIGYQLDRPRGGGATDLAAEVLFSRPPHFFLYVSPTIAVSLKSPGNFRKCLYDADLPFATVFGKAHDPSSDVNLGSGDCKVLGDPSLKFPGCVAWKTLDDRPEMRESTRRLLAALRDLFIFEGPEELRALLALLRDPDKSQAIGLHDAAVLASFPFVSGQLASATAKLSKDSPRPDALLRGPFLPLTAVRLIRNLTCATWEATYTDASANAWRDLLPAPAVLNDSLEQVAQAAPAIAARMRRMLTPPAVTLPTPSAQLPAARADGPSNAFAPTRRKRRKVQLQLQQQPAAGIAEALELLPAAERSAVTKLCGKRPGSAVIVIFVGSFLFAPTKPAVPFERLSVLTPFLSSDVFLVVSAAEASRNVENLLPYRRQLRTHYWYIQSYQNVQAIELGEGAHEAAPQEEAKSADAAFRSWLGFIKRHIHDESSASVANALSRPLLIPHIRPLSSEPLFNRHVFFVVPDAGVADLRFPYVENAEQQILLNVGARSLRSALRKLDLKEQAWLDAATAKLKRSSSEPGAEYISKLASSAPCMQVHAIFILPLWCAEVLSALRPRSFGEEDEEDEEDEENGPVYGSSLWSGRLLKRLSSGLEQVAPKSAEILSDLQVLCKMQKEHPLRDLAAFLRGEHRQTNESRLRVAVTSLDLVGCVHWQGLVELAPFTFAWDSSLREFCEFC